MTRYLVIGNSAGGVGAAEAIREVDRRGPLTVVSEEPYPAYSRPQISRYLAGEVPIECLAYRPPSYYESEGIRVILGHALARIDLSAHQVELADGQRLPWDRLLLATGGTPIVPPAEGIADHDYFTFTTLDDARRLAAHLATHRQAVVVGGGLIGLSVTAALIKLGVQVTIVELAPQILARALDARAASLVRQAIERAGVRVLTGHTISAVLGERRGNRKVRAVSLDDGSELPCDTLIIAIGVQPRLAAVTGTGLATQRGIIVDRRMATSHPEVYACGDVAEAYDLIAGGNRVTPIWPNAYVGGRIAGFNMAGREAIYEGGMAMNSLHYFGLSVMSAGIVDPPAGDGTYQILRREDVARGIYKKIVLHHDRLVGMIFAGDIDRAGIVFGLMRSGTPVGAFRDRLLGDDLGLLSLPRELRQSLMTT